MSCKSDISYNGSSSTAREPSKEHIQWNNYYKMYSLFNTTQKRFY